MLSISQIKFLQSLKQKKYRQQHQCFVAEGRHLVEELLQSPLKIIHIYATQEWMDNHPQVVAAAGQQIMVASRKDMERISNLKTAAGVLAVLATPLYIFDPEVAQYNIILMLDTINDPGNLGTIVRTADWFGIRHIVCSPETVDLFNPKTIQATMGSVARVRVYYQSLETILSSLEKGIPVFGAVLNGKPVDQLPNRGNGVIVIGSESHGISEHLYPYITDFISIPAAIQEGEGIQRAESLNASVATAIICWEFTKKKL